MPSVSLFAPSLKAAILWLLLAVVFAPAPSQAQTKRALLIGIDTYTAQAQETYLAKAESEGAPAASASADRGSVRGWTDLDGAVNDAQALGALLTTRFGFDAENVRLLLNTDATREGILQALRDLIAEAGPGDAVVFMYAGHGSQVRNTGSDEADRLDESIVPADSRLGAADIRDKELRVLFNELLATGAEVTIIFDSCHSGSVTRGISPGKSRNLKPSDAVIHDESPLPPPAQAHPAALVLSAAQDNEPARELKDGDGTPHGAFSWALASVLRTATPDTPARELFLRVRAQMQGHGFTQEPVLAGSDIRRSRPLFGGASRGTRLGGTTVAVMDVDPGAITLQGGVALGLRPGCQLCALPDSPSAAPDTSRCVEVTRVDGLVRSTAQATTDGASFSPGDVLVVTRWVASPTAPLRLWIPPDRDAAEVEAAAAAFATLERESGAVRVNDPTRTPPTHVAAWTGEAWTLTGADETVTDLGGPLPDLDAAKTALAAAVSPRIFVQLPPTPGVAAGVREGLAEQSAIELSREGAGAHYVLVGAPTGRGLGFQWVYLHATESASSPALPPATRAVPGTNPDFAAGILIRFAERLNRVWGWMQLESPPDDGSFPYRLLGFEDIDSGELVSIADSLQWNRRYRVVVGAEKEELEAAKEKAYFASSAKRYVYLFAVDRTGAGILLYPAHGESVENDINLLDDVPDPERFTIPSSGYLFESYDADGDRRPDVDTFFLLTTAEPISAPGIVFTFEGVRGKPRAAGFSPLAQLLFDTGNGTRGTRTPVPTDWSIMRVPMTSVR